MWADKAAVKTWTFVSVHIWPGFSGRPSALEPVCDNGGIEHSRAMGGEWRACVLVHMEKSLFFVAEDLMLSPRCAAKIGRLASHGNGWTVTCQRRCFIETLEMVRDVFFFFSRNCTDFTPLCVFTSICTSAECRSLVFNQRGRRSFSTFTSRFPFQGSSARRRRCLMSNCQIYHKCVGSTETSLSNLQPQWGAAARCAIPHVHARTQTPTCASTVKAVSHEKDLVMRMINFVLNHI